MSYIHYYKMLQLKMPSEHFLAQSLILIMPRDVKQLVHYHISYNKSHDLELKSSGVYL